ncbi:cupin domain-containing protein [Rahnella sp. PCH160]|uniref:cupin domain-containing protein n=1 Tax=Rahnella sp. PCH160 TaxID=3447928 RepID=UPI0039FC3AD0
MALFDLKKEADSLPSAWRSRILGHVGRANLKVLRMDGRPVPAEVHDYDEGLLVVDGVLELSVAGERFTVRAGGLYVAKAGVEHTVEPGSTGTLVIIDLPEVAAY